MYPPHNTLFQGPSGYAGVSLVLMMRTESSSKTPVTDPIENLDAPKCLDDTADCAIELNGVEGMNQSCQRPNLEQWLLVVCGFCR
mmetsp:Transcript_12195/g.19828  ORF Transcript_12195/g.19828 Transcript_12195/m.19828 type:complete len:85 (-) Transcript_12195:660-914(-)